MCISEALSKVVYRQEYRMQSNVLGCEVRVLSGYRRKDSLSTQTVCSVTLVGFPFFFSIVRDQI